MSPEDRLCIICIDEISIKSNCFYKYGRDAIIGLEDNGDKKTEKTCFVCSSFNGSWYKNWKQPLGCVFCYNKYCWGNKTIGRKVCDGI